MGRPYGDFNVLSEHSEEIHKPLNGKRSGLSSHECGDMRLLDSKDIACLRLRQATLLD